MTRTCWRVSCPVLILLAIRATSTMAEPSDWLSARECGASGSVFETAVATTAGSPQITVSDVGDFQPGQEVMLFGCHPHYERCILKPPENPYATNPLGNVAEIRGYDGQAGDWAIYIVEVESTVPLCFRWSDDQARTWKAKGVPVTFDWQPLSGGTAIKFNQHDWQPGHIITCTGRNLLVTKIVGIEGTRITVADAPCQSNTAARLRHCDSAALQAAVKRALAENRNLHIPAGHYRLTKGLSVSNPKGLVIEGANGVETILDISEGYGSCVSLRGGAEVTVRNLRMVGHTGLGEGPGWRSFRTASGKACWPMGMKPCSAMHISNTERVLVENCHATRMNCEAFYCQGASRAGPKEPPAYTKILTFLRCSAINCDGNAFNNNDLAENTSVLYCRIQDVGGCTWEGASRFVRFIGNYVRGSGTIAMGNIRNRAEHLEQLGSGQHIIADNVFEERMFYAGRAGGYMIRAASGASQVIIRNNIFVNFASCGIDVSGMNTDRDLPAERVTVTGNIMDLTDVAQTNITRTAVNVSANGVLVSDNQIYVRGVCDPNVTGISVKEPAVDVIIHDNLIRNCGTGLVTGRAQGQIGQVIDRQTFLIGRGLPLPRRQSHGYRGWNLLWLSGDSAKTVSTIEGFDPETLHFTLREPLSFKAGDRLEIYPRTANWRLRANTITACRRPVVLDAEGSETSLLEENLISRGETDHVKQAVEVRARFKLIGNHFQGFDEAESAVLGLYPDPLGQPMPNTYLRNIFQGCAHVLAESQPGLWAASQTGDNHYTDCPDAPP